VLNELLDTTPTVRNMAYNQMRDKAMAENIKIILNTKKSKATL
jgi:hypothetical protein